MPNWNHAWSFRWFGQTSVLCKLPRVSHQHYGWDRSRRGVIALPDPDCMTDKRMIVALVGGPNSTFLGEALPASYALIFWTGIRKFRPLRFMVYRADRYHMSSESLSTAATTLTAIQTSADAKACIRRIVGSHDYWNGDILLDVAGNGTPKSGARRASRVRHPCLTEPHISEGRVKEILGSGSALAVPLQQCVSLAPVNRSDIVQNSDSNLLGLGSKSQFEFHHPVRADAHIIGRQEDVERLRRARRS